LHHYFIQVRLEFSARRIFADDNFLIFNFYSANVPGVNFGLRIISGTGFSTGRWTASV
jgi:hypothetical protein